MDSHTKAEQILTSSLNPTQHIEESKKKIQQLTQDLQNIVNSKYFDILSSAEALLDLSSSESLPQIAIPKCPEVPTPPQDSDSTDCYNEVWCCINQSQFTAAVELLLEDPSSNSDLLVYLSDPKNLNVFNCSQSVIRDRLASFALLLESQLEEVKVVLSDYLGSSLSESLAKIWVDQLCSVLVSNKTPQEYYQSLAKAKRVLKEEFREKKLNSFLKDKGLEVGLVANKVVSQRLKSTTKVAKENLKQYITGISSFEELNSYLEIDHKELGIPSLWNLIEEPVKLQTQKLLCGVIKVPQKQNVHSVLEDLEAKTKFAFEVLKKFKEAHSQQYLEELSKEICLSLAAEDSGSLFTGCFLLSLPKLPVLSLLNVSLEDKAQKILEAWFAQHQTSTCFELASELYEVCGEETDLVASKFNFSVGESQRLLGEILGLEVTVEEESGLELPVSKQKLEQLELPPRFFPHLLS